MTPPTSPSDTIQVLDDGSLVQSGPGSDRIYLMKPGRADNDALASELVETAREDGRSKIFAKVPGLRGLPFVNAGYVEEARVPAFYHGQQDAIFFAYYLDPARAAEPDAPRLDAILDTAVEVPVDPLPAPLEPRFALRPCVPADAPAMSRLYRSVFASYPFPIHDPAYLATTMAEDVAYYAVEADAKIVALSSAEMDVADANAEMTDFATHPDWRGRGFARRLLARMERDMKTRGIKTAYTIARAASTGMNITFGRAGYAFSGRSKNNTQIAGDLESMNVWHKPLWHERPRARPRRGWAPSPAR